MLLLAFGGVLGDAYFDGGQCLGVDVLAFVLRDDKGGVRAREWWRGGGQELVRGRGGKRGDAVYCTYTTEVRRHPCQASLPIHHLPPGKMTHMDVWRPVSSRSGQIYSCWSPLTVRRRKAFLLVSAMSLLLALNSEAAAAKSSVVLLPCLLSPGWQRKAILRCPVNGNVLGEGVKGVRRVFVSYLAIG